MKLHVKKALGELQLDVETHLDNQGISVLFGRSGSGKTSLINTIAGLITPDSGEILLGDHCFYSSDKGINLAASKRQIGYVFQEARLFPHYSVLGNLKYGYRAKEDSEGHRLSQIIELLALEPLLARYPHDLSGGEAQRVAIGRALLRRPKLLLLDEPLAALDTPRKRALLPFLLKLNRELALPMIYVTHSLDEVLFLADTLTLLEQGNIIAQGSVETLWNNNAMQPWLGDEPLSAVLQATLQQQHPTYPLSGLALGDNNTLWSKQISARLGSAMRLRIFARDVSLTLTKLAHDQTSIRNVFSAQILSIVHSADDSYIKLGLGQNILWAQLTRWACDDLALREGMQVFAQIKGGSVKQSDTAAL